MKVFILGYSNNPDRYSFKAYELLKDKGHTVIKINPSLQEYKSISEAFNKEGSPHTLTIYVNPEISQSLSEEILKIKPQRVVFNPGTENLELIKKLAQHGIEVVQGCTLIMLKTGQF